MDSNQKSLEKEYRKSLFEELFRSLKQRKLKINSLFEASLFN